jgi:hypothetical protein
MTAVNTDIRSTPPRNHEAIVVDVEFGFISNAIWVGGAGDVELMMAGDDSIVLYSGAQAGSYIIGRFKKVISTNTTATLLVNQW